MTRRLVRSGRGMRTVHVAGCDHVGPGERDWPWAARVTLDEVRGVVAVYHLAACRFCRPLDVASAEPLCTWPGCARPVAAARLDEHTRWHLREAHRPL